VHKVAASLATKKKGLARPAKPFSSSKSH